MHLLLFKLFQEGAAHIDTTMYVLFSYFLDNSVVTVLYLFLICSL